MTDDLIWWDDYTQFASAIPLHFHVNIVVAAVNDLGYRSPRLRWYRVRVILPHFHHLNSCIHLEDAVTDMANVSFRAVDRFLLLLAFNVYSEVLLIDGDIVY